MPAVANVTPDGELGGARVAEGKLARSSELEPVELPQLGQNLAPATTGLPQWEQNATLDLTLWV